MAGNLAGSAFPRALRLLAVQQMLSSASFTMQMPTAWPLLQALGGRRAALGIIVGGHPAGARSLSAVARRTSPPKLSVSSLVD